MKLLQAPGSWRRRIVWPVGAVSKMMCSKRVSREASVSKPVNSSNAAISVVQAPESCSLILLTTSSGRRPLIGSTILERYCWAASCGSISRAESPGTAVTGRMVLPIAWSNTCPTFEAGSVLTSKTRLPCSARRIAVAQEMEVFPTPPLPVKNR